MKTKTNSRLIAIVLAILTIISSAIPAFAADMEIYTYDGNDIISSVNVTATIADGSDVYDPENPDAGDDGFVNGKIQVGVPTSITINGTTDANGYYVGSASGKVKGNISGATVINVEPDDKVTLTSQGKTDVVAPIEQDYTQFVVSTSEYSGAKVNKYVTPEFNDNAVFDVTIKTKDLSAGTWSGSFNYNISVVNTTVASLGNRVTSWNVSATDEDNVWMSYYQANTRQATAPTRGGTTIEKYEDGTVVISGTGNMEDSVNKHFFDLEGMTKQLNILIWEYLEENLSNDEYNAITDIVPEGAQTWYYTAAHVLNSNLSDYTTASDIVKKFRDAEDYAMRRVSANDYMLYVPKRVIVMDGVTNISESAFNGCTFLTEVDLGNTIKSIENYAFTNCYNIEGIKIPDGCEKIGDAFGVTHKIDVLNIPASVKDLAGTVAFAYKKLEIDPANPYYFLENGVIYTKDGKTLYGLTKDSSSDLVIREGVETINNGVFQKKMNSLTLPSTLNEMSYGVFGNYSNLEVICKSQRAYDIMMDLIAAKDNTSMAFKGTVTLSIDER